MRRLPLSQRTEGYCPACKQILPAAKFADRPLERNCKDCRNARRRAERALAAAGKPHELAFVHVLQNRYTGELVKATLTGEVPEGYVIIYRAEGGYLLPVRFKELKVYDEKLQTVT